MARAQFFRSSREAISCITGGVWLDVLLLFIHDWLRLTEQ
jgi:hypothetical protein